MLNMEFFLRVSVVSSASDWMAGVLVATGQCLVVFPRMLTYVTV